MQKLVILLFLLIFSVDYLSDVAEVIDGKYTLAQEGLSAVATILIIGHFVRNKILILDIKYILLFALLFIHIINGLIIEGFSTGSIVAGSRIYFKYLPFYLLASVYTFSEKQINQQLKILLFLFLLQFPISLLQKYTFFADNLSGDVVRGSLTTSSFLSIALIGAISMIFAFYLKNKISFKKFIVIALILFIPTTINETKGTLILLPIAIFTPIIVLRLRGELIQGLFRPIVAITLLLVCFVTIYDSFWGKRYGAEGSIIDFYTDSERIKRYLAPKTAKKIPDEYERSGRVDNVVTAFNTLHQKGLVELMVGLGMGSVTKSPIEELSGEYVHYRDEGLVTISVAYLLYELGILGIIFSVIFIFLIFKDALYLSHGSGLANIIGLGWLGVVPVILVSLMYKDIIPVNSIMYLFWYFSGYVAANSLVQKNLSRNVLNTH